MLFSKLRIVSLCTLIVFLLIGVTTRLAAQGTTGTILGTVTDSSGGAIPDAMVRVTNSGTNATQTITSDAQGRYRVPDLPVGEYQVETEKTGFQSVVHRGIALDPGANVVVDFSLPVGQVTQAVTVEGNVTQVETTSAAISSVVQPVQMRDLPLNGRNFEELILLAPGVTVNNGADVTRSSFTGNSNFWSVSGSRANGQGELLDGTDIQNYQDRGAGSGILGTTLGVDAIAEFQILTNTYGAQYGGNGSVVNAVTRSGTNDLHGSLYEFLRNSALDARNFADTTRQPFKKNQFGGTLGGPIKKDKMFFFVNYEGIRQNLGLSQITTVPDFYSREGLLPTTLAPAGSCVSGAGTINGVPYSNCGAGSPNAAKFAVVQPYFNVYPVAPSASELFSKGVPTGTTNITQTAPEPGTEDYVVGRYDWTIASKDSLFVRYLLDNATLTEPFYGPFAIWPDHDRTRNQFGTIGEKHILSNNVINAFNLGYARTFLNISSQSILPNPTGQPGTLPAGSLDFSGNLFTQAGEPIGDGEVAPGSGIATLGPNRVNPIRYAQNKISVGDNIFWTKGAHSFTLGGSAIRMQTNGLHPGDSGTWTFPNLAGFVTDSPSSYIGPCNYNNGAMPDCVFAGTNNPLPFPTSQHDMRETDFAMFVQDDWKVRPTLTVNLGLRYAPTSNPWDAYHELYTLLPVPFGPNGNESPAVGNALPTNVTPVSNFMLKNPSLHDIDPRIGLAWDPFKDHKTSVRVGYGIFHAVTQPRDYSYGAFFGFPWTDSTQTVNLTFPNPFLAPGAAAQGSQIWGTNPFNTTPYLQQWNLSLQREVMKDTIVTIAYVGSHGVHLVAQRDVNPPVPYGGITGAGVGAIQLAAGQTLYPNYAGQTATLVQVGSPGASTITTNANGSITCTGGPCYLASPNGAPIIDPNTGEESFSHIVQNSASPVGSQYSIQSNTRVNPNFSYIDEGVTDSQSFYNALQTGIVRRMSNNFSVQISYTYSDCVDTSSGNWSLEGGTLDLDPYDLAVDRGPCVFMVRHNLSTNGLYILPFKGNQLVSGWQLGGIFYVSSGGRFNPTMFSNGSTDIASPAANRPDYVPGAAGCNGQPINSNPVTGTGVFYLNDACFAPAPVGEVGNVSRDDFSGPLAITLNTAVQKNTKLSERFNLQFRWEAFNILNRKNFTPPSGAFSQNSGCTTAACIGGGTPASNFGQITNTIGYPLNGSARQMQFGLKLIF